MYVIVDKMTLFIIFHPEKARIMRNAMTRCKSEQIHTKTVWIS